MPRQRWKAYDYQAQLGAGGSVVYRPLIQIEISRRAEDASTVVLALIDSGTDSTVMNAVFAPRLGIDKNACQTVRLGGIGTSNGFICNIRMRVPDFGVSIDLPVIFIENPPFDALLGQRHFFEKFDVKFEKHRNKFHLAVVG